MINKLCISIIMGFLSLCALHTAAQQPTDVNTTDEQLQINKETFLRGSTEQIRIAAAGLLLESENPDARKILIDALADANNTSARLALCKALTEDGKLKIINKRQLIIPLLESLSLAKDNDVRIISEALLVFDYEQLESPLREIISDPKRPVEARLNCIYTLRLQRDMRAIVWLIKLLGDTEPRVVEAASEALNSLGIPAVGKDDATRRQMIDEIQRIGKDEFLRYWEIRQGYEKQITALREQRDWWKQKYLASLDELYTTIGSDEAARNKFLGSRLNSTEADVRLWAVAKVTRWWVGTEPKSRLLAELGPALLKLISDQNSDVRLNTAKLIALMSELDSAQLLLEQIKQEQDDTIRTEQFIALGQACRYAFSAKSPVKLDESIREETLTLAVKYLGSNEPFKAQKGAEVIRNLLEFSGLSEEKAEIYLIALAQRYELNSQTDALSGELLNSMAILCGQSSYRTRSAQLYEKYFIDALQSESDLVREAAVNGLINIDKSAALRQLRTEFINDKDVNIRKQLISLAEEVGTIDDLVWLVDKINANAEGPAAWKAMISIFEDSSVAILNEWIPKLEEKGINDARMISFLELTERKASAGGKTEMTKNVRNKLVKLYTETGDLVRAAEYLGNLLKEETDQNSRQKLRANLMKVYLDAGNVKAAVLLIANRLLEADVRADSPLIKVIDEFIKEPNSSVEPKILLEELSKIDVSSAGDRPKWKSQIISWNRFIANTPQHEQPESTEDSNSQ